MTCCSQQFDGRSCQAPTAISIHKNIPIVSSYLISKPILYPFSVGAPENIGLCVCPGEQMPQKSFHCNDACPYGYNAPMVRRRCRRRGTLTRSPESSTTRGCKTGNIHCHELALECVSTFGNFWSRRQDQGQGWLYI